MYTRVHNCGMCVTEGRPGWMRARQIFSSREIVYAHASALVLRRYHLPRSVSGPASSEQTPSAALCRWCGRELNPRLHPSLQNLQMAIVMHVGGETRAQATRLITVESLGCLAPCLSGTSSLCRYHPISSHMSHSQSKPPHIPTFPEPSPSMPKFPHRPLPTPSATRLDSHLSMDLDRVANCQCQ